MPARIFVAVDTTDLDAATGLAARLGGAAGGIKLGLEFFCAHGPSGVRRVAETGGGVPLFLDLKFHDIPNTVAGAVRAVAPLRPHLMTVHAGGGVAMMRAAAETAAEAAAKLGVERPALVGVTVLTSLGQDALPGLGVEGSVADHVRRLADRAREAGLDGVVCSAHEIAVLRRHCGPDFRLVVPGIRPSWAAADDQARVMTPEEAVAAGADHLVIGRPITRADDPAAALQCILDGIGGR